MKRLKRCSLITVIFLLTLCITLMGCSGSTPSPSNGSTDVNRDNSSGENNDATEEELETETKLEPANIIWYTVGEQHEDHDEVWGEFNDYLKSKIGTTIDLKFTTWTDWETKYNVLLTSGERIDGIFTSRWANFYSYAKMGAFQDITDLLPVYAPESWSEITEQQWQEATVDGKIYAFPTNDREFTPDGMLYREDWRKELGCPEIVDIDTMAKYFDAVKNEKDITPINGTGANIIERSAWYDGDFYHIAGEEGLIVKVQGYDTPRNVVSFVHSDTFMKMAKNAEEWQKAGYWPPDAISSTVNTEDTIKAGTGAAHWANPAGARGVIVGQIKEGNPAEFGYFPFTKMTNVAVPNVSTNNAFSVPKSAKYPENTIAAIELIRNDRTAHDLNFYGIEGKHWSLNGEGKVVIPAEGLDPTEVKGWGYANWAFRNPEMQYPPLVDWDGWEPINDYFDSIEQPNIHTPFFLDKDPIKAELAAIEQIKAQYHSQIIYGMGDAEQLVTEYRTELEKAGLQKVIDEIANQLYDYYDSVGIK